MMSIKYNNDSIDISSNLQQLKDSLTCKLCNNLPIKPVRIVTCSHSFCDACIEKKASCVVCKQLFMKNELLENTYAECQIRCLLRIEDLIGSQDIVKTLTEAPIVQQSNSPGTGPINLPNGFQRVLYPKIVWYEVSNKTDPNTKKRNKVGETVLHKACIQGDVGAVQSYINIVKNVNIPDNYNWTPLHEACKAGHLEVVKLLLEAGAVVNVPSVSYDTPLHFAVKHGHAEIVRQLIAYGAEATAKTYEGVTPFDLANDQLKQIIENTQPTKMHPPTVIVSPLNVEIVPAANLGTKLVNMSTETFSLKVNKTISEKTAVLIVGTQVCEMSFSILRAILNGVWIVTIDWYTATTKSNAILDPTPYEITGTKDFPESHASRKARLCRQLLGPRLFHGCNFYVHGQKYSDDANHLVFSKQDVTNLITAGGGNILKRCPRPESLADKHLRYPFHAGGKLEQCTNYIVYLEQPLQPEYRFPEIHTLHVTWLFKCIQNYRISYF